MQVTFLGTGTAMPVPDRAQTGLLVEGGERPLLVDCGAGVLHNLAGTDVGYEGVSSVLLTHLHLDHTSDLLALLQARWLAGEEHLEVVGPVGTKAFLDDSMAVHDYLEGRMDLTAREVAPGDAVEVAGYEVTSAETTHSLHCLAYRFAGEDGDFTFSGDTEADESVATFADGSRVLVHDCSFPDGVDVSNHPTPSQLGAVLADVGVDRLYITHLYPHTEDKHEEMLASLAEAGFDGDVRVARDGLRFEV